MEATTPTKARAGHWTSKFKRASVEERTSPDGIVHDSVGEMKRWCRLLVLQSEKFIYDLERQVPLPLILPNGVPVLSLKKKKRSKKTGKLNESGGKQINYKLDFRYRDQFGTLVHEEFKGHMDDEAALKLAVVQAIYGITITIVKKP